MLWPFSKQGNKPTDAPKASRTSSADYPYGDDGSVWLSSADDLMVRAEKIVWIMGYRGAVGSYVLNVYKLLREYQRHDAAAAAKSEEAQ